jgi:hypothetical protein
LDGGGRILVATGAAKVEEHHETRTPSKLLVLLHMSFILLLRHVVLATILPLVSGDVVLA